MNVRINGEIRVALSERNLADLARQAADGGNEFIYGDDVVVAQLVRACETDVDGERLFLRVVVETDAAHYALRGGVGAAGPGVWAGGELAPEELRGFEANLLDDEARKAMNDQQLAEDAADRAADDGHDIGGEG